VKIISLQINRLITFLNYRIFRLKPNVCACAYNYFKNKLVLTVYRQNTVRFYAHNFVKTISKLKSLRLRRVLMTANLDKMNYIPRNIVNWIDSSTNVFSAGTAWPNYYTYYLSVCLPAYSCCSRLEHRASVKRFVSLQFLNLRQLVGLLGRGISQSQGRATYTNTE
jgi:hypothetical protein